MTADNLKSNFWLPLLRVIHIPPSEVASVTATVRAGVQLDIL
jgi:hypothetical protein